MSQPLGCTPTLLRQVLTAPHPRSRHPKRRVRPEAPFGGHWLCHSPLRCDLAACSALAGEFAGTGGDSAPHAKLLSPHPSKQRRLGNDLGEGGEICERPALRLKGHLRTAGKKALDGWQRLEPAAPHLCCRRSRRRPCWSSRRSSRGTSPRTCRRSRSSSRSWCSGPSSRT